MTEVRYTRDDLAKRATIAIIGPFNLTKLLDVLEQHRAAGAWSYGVLYDFRLMSHQPDKRTLRELARRLAPRPGEPARGPIAFVATDVEVYSNVCAYAALVKNQATVEVFREMDDAEAWLAAGRA